MLEGVASWYGPRFDGKKTANGERFDQDALTAAHATIAFGSKVRVTNLENGRKVVVRINDRPGDPDRIIDLSRAAGRRSASSIRERRGCVSKSSTDSAIAVLTY